MPLQYIGISAFAFSSDSLCIMLSFDAWTLISGLHTYRNSWMYLSMLLLHTIYPHISYLLTILNYHPYHFIMQNESSSDSQSGESELSQSPNDQPTNPGFIITPDDIGILQGYLEEFQEADTSLRTRLIEKAMAELYQLRPSNASFDKKEASKVYSIQIIMAYSLFHTAENTEVVL